jgi:hypothetical protein
VGQAAAVGLDAAVLQRVQQVVERRHELDDTRRIMKRRAGAGTPGGAPERLRIVARPRLHSLAVIVPLQRRGDNLALNASRPAN